MVLMFLISFPSVTMMPPLRPIRRVISWLHSMVDKAGRRADRVIPSLSAKARSVPIFSDPKDYERFRIES